MESPPYSDALSLTPPSRAGQGGGAHIGIAERDGDKMRVVYVSVMRRFMSVAMNVTCGNYLNRCNSAEIRTTIFVIIYGLFFRSVARDTV